MTGLLDQFTLSDMRAKDASGVICARIIDQDGKPMPAPKERQMIGVSLDQMRDKDMGMLVSAGLDGLPAARAAMKGGYVTHLVLLCVCGTAFAGSVNCGCATGHIRKLRINCTSAIHADFLTASDGRAGPALS